MRPAWRMWCRGSSRCSTATPSPTFLPTSGRSRPSASSAKTTRATRRPLAEEAPSTRLFASSLTVETRRAGCARALRLAASPAAIRTFARRSLRRPACARPLRCCRRTLRRIRGRSRCLTLSTSRERFTPLTCSSRQRSVPHRRQPCRAFTRRSFRRVMGRRRRISSRRRPRGRGRINSRRWVITSARPSHPMTLLPIGTYRRGMSMSWTRRRMSGRR